jgi:hypothetical protein
MQWSDIADPPPASKLRQFAACAALVCGGLAAWQLALNIGSPPGWFLAAAALTAALAGWRRPNWLAPLFTASLIAVFPLAWLVSTILLMLAYYLVLTPIALVLRLSGHDALDLRRPANEDSYWTAKPRDPDARRYLKQF